MHTADPAKALILQHQAQPLANLGHVCTLLAFIFALCAIAAYITLARRPANTRLQTIARTLYALTATFIFGTFGILGSIAYRMDYRFQYAYEHTGSDLLKPDILHHWLRFAATWSGQEGSFLLWASWTAIIGFLVLSRAGKYESRVMPFIISVLAFLAAILLKQSPFDLVPLPTHDMWLGGAMFPPLDGQGLNPSLQNYWMTIHPPTIFFGFASLVVPFAYSMAALIWRDYDGWTRRVMPYSLLTCATLGIGLFMGGYWAYETQGWHGFWAWDPVENASFFPWLAITALVHGLVVQKSRGGMGRTNTFLGILAFWLFVLGTFLTRSGILADVSVHAFGNIGKSGLIFMVVMMAVYGFGGFGLWLFRLPSIPRRKTTGDTLVSRDFAFFMAVLLMVMACVIVTLGTTWPLVLKVRHLTPAALQAVYYNSAMLPIAIVTAFFMACVPWLAWRRTDPEVFLRRLLVPWFISLAFGFFMLFWVLMAQQDMHAPEVHDLTDPNVINAMHAWHSDALQRILVIVLATLGFLSALSNSVLVFRVARKKPLAAGGWIAHVGIGILMIGVIVSNTFERTTYLQLVQGAPAREAFGYKFSFEKMTGRPYDFRPNNPDYDKSNAVDIRVTPPDADSSKSDGSPVTYLMSPRWFIESLRVDSEKDIKHVYWPEIHKYAAHDLYVTLANDAEYHWATEDPDARTVDAVLLPKEKRKFGDYTIGYFNSVRTPGVKMEVHLAILTPDGRVVEADPAIQMDGGTLTPVNVPVKGITDKDGNPGAIYLDGLDPQTYAASLRIDLPGYSGIWVVPVAVTYKPWVNLVWIGVLLTVFGTLVAMLRRILEGRKVDDPALIPPTKAEVEPWEFPTTG